LSPTKFSIELLRQQSRVNRATGQSEVYDHRRFFGRTGDDDFRVKDCAGGVIGQTEIKKIGISLFGFRDECGFSDRKTERLGVQVD
jgi:hypothetical protein